MCETRSIQTIGAFVFTLLALWTVDVSAVPPAAPGDMLVSSISPENAVRHYRDCASEGFFFDSGSGGLNRAYAVIFGPGGHLYVSSNSSDQIMRYNGATGAPLPAPGNTGAVFAQGCDLDGPAGLSFGPDGDLYVCSKLNDRIVVYSGIDGSCINPSFAADSCLVQPHDIAFGPDGHLYVTGEAGATNKVCRFDGDSGDPLPADGQTCCTFAFDAGCSGYTGLSFSPDGYLYVACAATNNVVRFDATTGAYVDEYCGGNTDVLEHPSDLALGPDGLLYVVGVLSDNVVACDGSQMTECVSGVTYAHYLTFAPGQGIPTVSEWGLVAMTLLFLTAGTVVYARRRGLRVAD